MIEFLQQLVNGLAQGSIYALIALGYTMVYGVLRFINFAHGDVYMLGAFAGPYAAPRLLQAFGGGPSLAARQRRCSLRCSFARSSAFSLNDLLPPLRERPRLTVLITAIGVSLFIENAGQYALGAKPKSFPEIISDRAIEIPNLSAHFHPDDNLGQLIVIGVTLLLLIGLRAIVLHTRLGMAMRALSFNPLAASLMGVNADVVISFTFALGSALAGAAGILTSIQQPSIDPLMGVNAGLKAFVAAVLGGIGNIPGAALGGVLIGFLEALVVGYINPTYRDAIVFAVLILILLLKPSGLLGKAEGEKV